MAKHVKHSKKSQSSSLGPIICSTMKPNCGPNVDSDGFTTVGQKGDTANAPPTLAQPSPLTTTQHNQLSLASPSFYDQVCPDQDVTNYQSCDVPTLVDHTTTTDDDYHNPEAAVHWHGFTSGTTTRLIPDKLIHSQTASQQSSSGLSFLDESNCVPHHSSCVPPAHCSHTHTIDAH
jgi:hypothetical protein